MVDLYKTLQERRELIIGCKKYITDLERQTSVPEKKIEICQNELNRQINLLREKRYMKYYI